MNTYNIKLVKSRKGVIPLGLVAEAMARDDATQGGSLEFHRPTFDNMFRTRSADILAAARSGRLVVCNSTGAESSADAIVQAARITMEPFNPEQLAYFEKDDTQRDMLYTTAKRLNEWRENTGEKFSVVDQASKMVVFGNGRYRGEVPVDDLEPTITAAICASPVAEKRVIKLRRDILDPAIDKAIDRVGSSDLAAVWLKLKDLAIAEELPFTGVPEGAALCYTDVNDKPKKLTKAALGKRLNRRAKIGR